MEEKSLQYSDITRKIIGSAMKVHRALGNGFQEVIYQRALAIELAKNSLNFIREQEMPIFYEGEDIGTRRVDFLVEDKNLVELKAIILLEGVHLAQAKNYLEAYNLPYRNLNILAYLEGSDPFEGGQTPRKIAAMCAA